MARGGARPGAGRKPGFVSEHRKFTERTKTVRVPETWDVAAIAKTLEELRAITERWGEILSHKQDQNGQVTTPRWQKAWELWKELRATLECGRAS
jgi:hypothetical protein